MTHFQISRRDALKGVLGLGAGACIARAPSAQGFTAANDRPRVGAVGTGSRWCIKATGLPLGYGTAPEFKNLGDYVVVCDVDAARRGRAAELVKEWCGKSPDTVLDYRAVLDRKDVEIVHITTPDHWHAKVAIEAMLAGKDVYCEKPMTLTIDEGKKICEIARKTGRIVQIGTQQRSELTFLKAIALIRDNRIGRLKKATCSIGGAPDSPSLPVASPPTGFDWNLWLGPTPRVEYRYLAGDHGETKSWSRSHYEFRWWYEYSGGKLTDWGAHHVDIATWAMGKAETGPVSVEPILAKHPVEFKDGYPIDDSRYNTATEFLIRARYADGMELDIRHDGDNGIVFEGTEGRIFVARGKLSGEAVERLSEKPLPEGAIEQVYKGQPRVGHIRNFFDCVASRREPISDVFSHHRALTTCHLAGIAARLGRTLTWDPVHESIVNDAQAQSFLAREARKGFEIRVS